MTIDRDKFLSALLAVSLGGAAAACGSTPPPEPAPLPEESAGAEEPIAEPAPPPAEEPAPEPVEEPEVVQTSPTTE